MPWAFRTPLIKILEGPLEGGGRREKEGMTQKYACDRNLLILLVSKLSSSVVSSYKKKPICFPTTTIYLKLIIIIQVYTASNFIGDLTRPKLTGYD